MTKLDINIQGNAVKIRFLKNENNVMNSKYKNI